MPDLIQSLTQFGAAGLIGLLWLMERRHALKRDRQLDAAHQSILRNRTELNALLSVIKENTRAITTLERSQRRLIGLIHRLVDDDARGGTASHHARQ